MGNETSKKDEQDVAPKYEDCMARMNWAVADKDIAAMKHKLKKQLEDVPGKYDDPTFIKMKNDDPRFILMNVGEVIGANKDELKSTIEKPKA